MQACSAYVHSWPVHGYLPLLHWQHSLTAGDQIKMDRSFPSCKTEHVHQQRQNGRFHDGIQHSNRLWICCCSLMKSWLIKFFYTKVALIQSAHWWVSFTHSWAVFTYLGRPDEWLVEHWYSHAITIVRHEQSLKSQTKPIPFSSESKWTLWCILGKVDQDKRLNPQKYLLEDLC